MPFYFNKNGTNRIKYLHLYKIQKYYIRYKKNISVSDLSAIQAQKL